MPCFYKCDEQLVPSVYQCAESASYSRQLNRCSYTPTQVRTENTSNISIIIISNALGVYSKQCGGIWFSLSFSMFPSQVVNRDSLFTEDDEFPMCFRPGRFR